MQIETPSSAENSDIAYPNYLADEQERKANYIYNHRSLIRFMVTYKNDGKPQPLYSFKKSLIGMCIAYVIYYFLGLFS